MSSAVTSSPPSSPPAVPLMSREHQVQTFGLGGVAIGRSITVNTVISKCSLFDCYFGYLTCQCLTWDRKGSQCALAQGACIDAKKLSDNDSPGVSKPEVVGTSSLASFILCGKLVVDDVEVKSTCCECGVAYITYICGSYDGQKGQPCEFLCCDICPDQ